MPSPTASSKLLEPILQLASHYPGTRSNGDSDSWLTDALLNDAGISEQDLSRPDARFAAERFEQVLRRLSDASGNPYINLRLAEATQPRMLGSTGFLISTAETLGDALRLLEEYLPILFEAASLELTPEADNTRLILTVPPQQQKVSEFFLACLMNWPRWLTGQQIPVSDVELSIPEPENPARYRQLFAAEVHFNAGRNTIRLPSHYLSLPCVDANREMHLLHKEFADALLSQSHGKMALSAQVRSLIRKQLLTQNEAIRREEVAAQLGLSLRTLQRKLGELDTNFQTLYDQTRKEICLQLIRKGQLSFGEIAFQLGFSNPSAFQKAFKRWTGMAPSKYRQRLEKTVPQETGNSEHQLADFVPAASAELLAPDQPAAPLSLAQKLEQLNPFGRKILRQAAVFGEVFQLHYLSRLSDDPEARLMIHLWPAQQEQLIEPVPGQEDQLTFRFTRPGISNILYDQVSRKKQQALHRHYARLLYATLGNTPEPEHLQQVLHHLNRLDISPQPPSAPEETEALPVTDYRVRVRLNQQAAEHALTAGNPDESRYYLDQAEQVLTPLLQTRDPSCPDLLCHQAQHLLQLPDITAAENLLSRTTQAPASSAGKIRLALLQANINSCRGQTTEALTRLMSCLESPLPRRSSDQLVFLLQGLEQLRHRPLSAHRSHALQEQPLLQNISLLARTSEPLLAACAAVQMLLSLPEASKETASDAYACTVGAWAAETFAADRTLAHRLLQRARPEARPENSLQIWFRGYIQPWQVALSRVIRHLPATLTGQPGQDIQTGPAMRILWYQLVSMTGSRNLSRLRRQSQEEAQHLKEVAPVPARMLIRAGSLLADYLQAKALLPREPLYDAPDQAVTVIRAALLLNDQVVWPQLLHWQAQLESDLAGHLMLTEALFSLGMMRLIRSQQEQRVSRRRQRVIEQTEARFELWSQGCPDNFSGQLQLLQAERARLNPETRQHAGPLYEAALQTLNATTLLPHRALAYERYADYLIHAGQPLLAGFCYQQAHRHYQHWGADAKAEQLNHTLRQLN